MRVVLLILCAMALTNCTTSLPGWPDPVYTAQPYIGLEERLDRSRLRELVGVDPVRTEWCAAFVNAILDKDGIPGSDTVSDYPLTARSFLQWGTGIDSTDIQRGDIVIFPRGNQGWQGHVGFYVETQITDGVEYWVILGGNQSNQVNYELYRASSSLGIRRWQELTSESVLPFRHRI